VFERLLLPLAGLPVLLIIAWLRVRSGMSRRKTAAEFALGLYALLAASVVFLPVHVDLTRLTFSMRPPTSAGTEWINAVPLRTIGRLGRGTFTEFVWAAGNVLLLVPLGVLAPVAFPQLRDWRRFVPIALGTAALIEGVQFLELVTRSAFRSVDIDDVILNTLGALLGFALFSVAARIVHGTA
jgi:glycopeptide antibiotics resistance protein